MYIRIINHYKNKKLMQVLDKYKIKLIDEYILMISF